MSDKTLTDARARIGLMKLDKNVSSITLHLITIIIASSRSPHSDHINSVSATVDETTQEIQTIPSRAKETFLAHAIVFATL